MNDCQIGKQICVDTPCKAVQLPVCWPAQSLDDCLTFQDSLRFLIHSSHTLNGFQCVDAKDDVYADVLSSVYNAVMISKVAIESSWTHGIRVTGGPSNESVYATKPGLLFCTHSANLYHLQNALFVQNNVG